METFDIDKFQKLFETGKKDEAKEYLGGFLSKDITSETRGKVLLQILSVYLEISNKLDEAYKAELQGILADLKTVNASERANEETIKLGMVRADLN